MPAAAHAQPAAAVPVPTILAEAPADPPIPILIGRAFGVAKRRTAIRPLLGAVAPAQRLRNAHVLAIIPVAAVA